MPQMIQRKAAREVEKLMQIFPAVVILGSRQCGKSTLVKMMSSEFSNLLYIDLQNLSDRAMLTDPALFFTHNEGRTVCLDEVQLMPELFSYLRSEIDRKRTAGRFILLGSASRQLMAHTTESLAGRVGLIDLTPFLASELDSLPDFDLTRYWFRGGYPDSYLALGDEASSLWCSNYLRTYIERDIPQLGFSIAAPKMMRLMMMLAHEHGDIVNYTKLASAMDLSAPTIRHYVDVLEGTYVVRILEPYYKNIKKRLVKTPRLYIRDTGLLHSVLGIRSFNELMGNPVFGSSWEGLVIENVCDTVKDATFSFYRSANGSEEMDLVIKRGNDLIAIECKASTAPQVHDTFYKALSTLRPTHAYVVAPITTAAYPIHENVDVIGLPELLERLRG